MAEIAHVVSRINDDAIQVVWSPLASGDTGQPHYGLSEYADRSVHVSGNLDGGSITVKGTNRKGDPAATLNDPSMVPLVLSASPKISAVLEYVDGIHPEAGGGAGGMSVTVVLLAKRLRR